MGEGGAIHPPFFILLTIYYEVNKMLGWACFASWLVIEFYLIWFLRCLIKEKKILISQLTDVKEVEINSVSDLLAITEPEHEYEEGLFLEPDTYY